MTKEELEKATGQELIEERNYCGVDGYYGDYLDNVNAEMLKRFNRLAELEQQIEKMKCCENCKYNSYWGDELHCNYGLKEAIKEDKLVECKNMDKWEIKENEKC